MNWTNDDALLEVMDRMEDAPRCVVGSHKYVYIGGAFVIMRRVGKGERWSFGPSDIVREVPTYHSREAREWGWRARQIDLSAYLRGVSQRVL